MKSKLVLVVGLAALLCSISSDGFADVQRNICIYNENGHTRDCLNGRPRIKEIATIDKEVFNIDVKMDDGLPNN